MNLKDTAVVRFVPFWKVPNTWLIQSKDNIQVDSLVLIFFKILPLKL